MKISIPSIINSGSICEAYTNRFLDIAKWVNSLTEVRPIVVNKRNEVLLLNPKHIAPCDEKTNFKSYGWKGLQDGIVFTSGGDNVHFLFRDGLVYSTFAGYLVVNSPTMTNDRKLEYWANYPKKDKNFLLAENYLHDELTDEWICNMSSKDKLNESNIIIS